MTRSKRFMDITLAVVFSVLLLPVILFVALLVLVIDGRPVLYPSERMKSPDQPFTLWKFRTMIPADEQTGVCDGGKSSRITRLGRILRRSRLDELPQLLNILKGDMSFVGPRPPLRRYVESCPEIYARVLQNRPGVTGLATLRFHRTEEELLSNCLCPDESDRLYIRRCVPKKAQLDLIWARNRTVWFDLWLVMETALRAFAPPSRR